MAFKSQILQILILQILLTGEHVKMGVCYARRDQSLVPVTGDAGILRLLVCSSGIERRHATR